MYKGRGTRDEGLCIRKISIVDQGMKWPGFLIEIQPCLLNSSSFLFPPSLVSFPG